MSAVFFGRPGGGGHPGHALRPPPATARPSPSTNPSSYPWGVPFVLLFFMQRVDQKIWGQGKWVWVDEWGLQNDKPLRMGGVLGKWHRQPEMPREGAGQVASPSSKRMKMFEMAKCLYPRHPEQGRTAFPVVLQLLADHGAGGYADILAEV